MKPDWSEELGAELRRDAATWNVAPSGNTAGRLRAAMAGFPVESPQRSPIIVGPVLAMGFLSLIAWGVWGGAAIQEAVHEQNLEQELGAIVEDMDALADAVWERVSVSLRRLLIG